jgi:hypothetical protein
MGVNFSKQSYKCLTRRKQKQQQRRFELPDNEVKSGKKEKSLINEGYKNRYLIEEALRRE